MNPKRLSPIAIPIFECPEPAGRPPMAEGITRAAARLHMLGARVIGVSIDYGGRIITFGDENRIFSGRHPFDRPGPSKICFFKTEYETVGRTSFSTDSLPTKEEKAVFLRDLAAQAKSDTGLARFISAHQELKDTSLN